MEYKNMCGSNSRADGAAINSLVA